MADGGDAARAAAASLNQGASSLLLPLSPLPPQRPSYRGCLTPVAAIVWRAEQLLHELERKFLSAKSELAVAEAEKQVLASDKRQARTCVYVCLSGDP